MPMPLDPTQVPSLGANGLPVPPVQQPQSAAPAQAKAASPASQSIPQPQASPAQTSYDKDPVAAILNQTQLSKAQKATIWDAFHKTKNINDFTKVLKSIDFSKQQKASLWDLKNHSDPLSFPSTNLDTPNSKFAPTSSVDTAPPKQHVSFTKDVRSGMADSLNPIPALKQLSGVTGYEEQQEHKKQLASYLPKGVTLESATPQQYTAAVNQYSAVTQKNQVTPSEFYNTVKTKLLNEVHTHPGYLAGQAAGLAFQYVLGKGLGKIIPTEAGTDVLTADQHSLLESSDEGKALKANMTASERQKPGTAKALGNFASLMPSSQKSVTKILAARKILLTKVMDQVADNFMSKIASGDKVLGDVKEAATAANQDRVVAGKINDETLSEVLTNGTKTNDMGTVGDAVASNISSTEASVKDTRNMLYDGLGPKLDEAGAKVPFKNTTLSAINIWRKEGNALPAALRGQARTALSRFIPFDRLDEAALELVNSRLKPGEDARKVAKFFNLSTKDQDAILANFRFSKLKASKSITLGKYLTSNMKNLTATTGLKSYVFSEINGVFKKSMEDAFEAASPELADIWKSAQGLSYAQSQRLKSSMYRSILNQNNKLSGEALTSKIINNPDDARTIMQNIDKDIDLESNTLVHSGSKYTDMLRKYTLDQLSTIGEDDPSNALDALQDQTKGYKDILGYKTKNQSAYDTAVGYWKNKVSLFNSSEAGISRRFLSEVTGTTEPQAIISKLIDPDKGAFADYIVKEAGSNTKVKEQLGHSMLSSIMDNSTNNGHFGTPEAVTDPVKLADNLQRSMPQLRKFLSPEVTKNLDTLSGVMRQMAIRGGQSMIGVYRSWTEAIGLLAGGFLLGGHAGLTATAALLVAPAIFMKAATNPTWTRLMIEGFHLSPGTQEYASWATKMAIVSNQIRAAAGAINKPQTQTPAQVPAQPKALSPVPAQ